MSNTYIYKNDIFWKDFRFLNSLLLCRFPIIPNITINTIMTMYYYNYYYYYWYDYYDFY